MSANVKTGVWITSQLYEKINAGFLTYSADDTPPPEPGTAGPLFFAGLSQYGTSGLNGTHNEQNSSAVQLPGTNWTGIDVRTHGLIALKCDSTLWSWGYNGCGQVGDNTTIGRSSPVQVPGTSWTCVASADYRSLALKSDCTLWSWGWAGAVNNFQFEGNKIGDNTYNIPRSSPTQIPGTAWCFIAANPKASYAIKTDGTLWGWGDGASAEALLSPNCQPSCVARFSSPVQLSGSNWVEVSPTAVSVTGRKTDGTIHTFGGTSFGEYGNGTRSNYSNQVQNQVPGTSWVQVGGGYAPIARKSDNTLWTWGQNYGGMLGTSEPQTSHKSSPVQVPGTAWCCIHNTRANGRRARVAKKTDGTSWGWSCNYRGSLQMCGDGVNSNFSSPVQIPGTIYCIGNGQYWSFQRR